MKPISASGIRMFRNCPRQWAFNYIAKLPKKQWPYFEFGTSLHSVAEHWLKTGELATDADQKILDLFCEGIPFLPEPGSVIVEGRQTFEIDDIPFIVIIDWRDDANQELGDHKTTGNPQWIMSPEKLATDTQAMLYAAYAVIELNWDPVNLKWLYYIKGGRGRARPVKAQVPIDHVLKQFDGLLDDARTMSGWLEQTKDLGYDDRLELANEFINKTSACGSVGKGCDFAGECDLFYEGSLNPNE